MPPLKPLPTQFHPPPAHQVTPMQRPTQHLPLAYAHEFPYSQLPLCSIRPHIASRRTAVTAQASFLPEPADAFIRNSVIIGSLAGISYSVLVAAATAPPPKQQLPGSSTQQQQQQQQQLPPGRKAAGGSSSSKADEEGDNFVWGVMGAISFLPLFGWLVRGFRAWALLEFYVKGLGRKA